ncbi:MAG: hypothetical protein RMI94_05655 [Bryobacterales bacterium]|nr:hypothetical protein [Bryobacteraceae bacterium]MDW8130015.1 hypothetical protein [Bryobacterales bacterium]
MHELIRERLEELLSGAPQPESGLEQHLVTCTECRDELAAFRQQSALLKTLRCAEALSPAPGFYARVWERIQLQRSASVWNALLDPGFAWRLALGSLAALLLMGAFVAMNEKAPPAPAVTAIVVDEQPQELGLDPERDRDAVLVTLATYRE